MSGCSVIRRVVVGLAVLVALSSDAFGLQFSMAAMACCAKTHHDCAGLKTADDCCQGMGHGTSTSASTTPSARNGHDASLLVAIIPTLAPLVVATSASFALEPTCKRPHDPPHLHPVPLLI